MQRTVHGTKITHGTVEIINGEVVLNTSAHMSTEKDEKVALKKFRKVNPTDAIISVEPFSQLYILDDEIFFKYATVAEDTIENTAED